VVWGADIDVRESVGGVEKFGGDAEVGDGLPNEEGFRSLGFNSFSSAENRVYELDATGWVATQVTGKC
jgi:hypothetical protein